MNSTKRAVATLMLAGAALATTGTAHATDTSRNGIGSDPKPVPTADGKFNHVDYLYGIDAPTLLYSRVLGLMKRH